MDFSRVEAAYRELKRQYDDGALAEADFKAQLQELMIEDDQGRWWMIGTETGRWYYHDGDEWVQSEPPVPARPEPPAPGPTSGGVVGWLAGEGPQRDLLSVMAAGALWWLLSKPLGLLAWEYTEFVTYSVSRRLGLLGGNLLFAAAATALVWWALRSRVRQRRVLFVALAAGWELGGRLFLVLGLWEWGPYIYVEVVRLWPVFEIAVIAALGAGIAYLLRRVLAPGRAGAQT